MRGAVAVDRTAMYIESLETHGLGIAVFHGIVENAWLPNNHNVPVVVFTRSRI